MAEKNTKKEEILNYLKERAEEINEAINDYLMNEGSERNIVKLLSRSGYEYDDKAIKRSIVEPANYLLQLGGKRWRSALMLTIIDALGKNSKDFIEFAMIPEIVHNGTLIHDDIEDGSELRRGKQAIHIRYGLDVALNLGDFMFYFPIVALLDSKKVSKDVKLKMLDVYQREMLKVSIGQATDIAWHRFMVNEYKVTEKQYLDMVYSKSGVLAEMAGSMGAILAGADDKIIDALGRFCATIGVAFQLEDDLLNVIESKVSQNKGGVGEDITEGKITMLVIYSIEHSNSEDAERLVSILRKHTKDQKEIAEAISIIKKCRADEYVQKLAYDLMATSWKKVDSLLPESSAKKKLKELAEFLINRDI